MKKILKYVLIFIFIIIVLPNLCTKKRKKQNVQTSETTEEEKQEIEKYDFIKYGFQYCGYASESLIVIECRNYETPDEKPKLEIKQISRLKRSLREFALEI